jgi:hypothetical protein
MRVNRTRFLWSNGVDPIGILRGRRIPHRAQYHRQSGARFYWHLWEMAWSGNVGEGLMFASGIPGYRDRVRLLMIGGRIAMPGSRTPAVRY